MPLIKEYINQNKWRNWEQYIHKLPIKRNETVLDLGCSLGFVSSLFAMRAKQVVGVDLNADLIREAQLRHSAHNIEYRIGNLAEINKLKLQQADGIWSSFTAAYFTNFDTVLDQWLTLLKPGGWVALVEIDNLFGHEPISQASQNLFKEFYQHQLNKGLYDFEMGSKLKGILESKKLQVIHEASIPDKELSFDGPAEPHIVKAWEMRFNRMKSLQKFLEKDFQKVKGEFISCLAKENHQCTSEVKFIVARK